MLPGEGTGLHDHGGSAGAFAVVRGTLHERVGARKGAAELSAGRVRHFGQHHVHPGVQYRHAGGGERARPHAAADRHEHLRVDGRGLVHTGTEGAGVDW